MRRFFRFPPLRVAVPVLLLCVGLVLFSRAVPVPEVPGPKDPAALLPSSTLAYLEFSQPQPVVQELTSLLKGSSLEDMPGFLAGFREKFGDDIPFWVSEGYSILGTFLGPEGLAEVGRLQAGCMALTGFDNNQEPELLWILLSGESNAPGLAMRAMLTSERNIRAVEKVGGINLYRQLNWSRRFRGFAKEKDKDGFIAPEEPETKFHGPTYALAGGALLIGSTQETVRDAILRLQGKKAEQSLAGSTAFRKTAKLRERPGLFAYADLGLLSAQVEKHIQADPQRARFDLPLWNSFKVLANPKALHTFAASLTLQKSGLDLQAQLHFDPRQDLPFLGVLPDKPVNVETLHFAPADSLAALTLSWPDGQKRWQKLLQLVDDMREDGADNLPSKAIEQLQDKLKFNIGKDLFGKVNGIGLIVGMPKALVALKGNDAEATKALETLLLGRIRLIDEDEKLLPTTHEVQGQEIRSFPATRQRSAPHYGRAGSTLVIGLTARQVASSLRAGARKEGLLAQPRLAETLKTLDEPLLVGVGSLNRMALAVMQTRQDDRTGDRPDDQKKEKENREAVEKLAGTLAKAAEEMPPAVLSVSRKGGVLTLSVRQTGLQSVSARTVDALMEWNLRQRIGERMFRGKDFPRFKDKDMAKDVPRFRDKEKEKEKGFVPEKDKR